MDGYLRNALKFPIGDVLWHVARIESKMGQVPEDKIMGWGAGAKRRGTIQYIQGIPKVIMNTLLCNPISNIVKF